LELPVSTTSVTLARRLTLDDPEKAWLIEGDSVDLFLAEFEKLEMCGNLDYVGTLEPGAALLGVGELISGKTRTTIIAQGGPSTRLRPMRFGPSQERSQHETEELQADHIDSWISTLADLCAPGLPPALSRQVEPGDVIQTGEDPSTLIGNRAVAWLSRAQAHLDIYGSPSRLEPSNGRPVPICRSLWVVAPPGETISASSTQQWLARFPQSAESAVNDLRGFHESALSELSRRRENRENAERTRFQERMKRDGAAFGSALQELISPLAPGTLEDEIGVVSDDAGYASALRASIAAARVIGIKIVAPLKEVPNERAGDAIMRIAAASGVRYRKVLLRDAWWKQDQGPMIGMTLDGASAVAFLPRGSSKYVMLDPLTNTEVAVTSDLSADLDPYAYVLYRPFPTRKLSAKDILLFGLRNGGVDLATILGVSAITGILSLALPIATGFLFDEIIPEGQRNSLIQMSVILLAATLAIFLMNLGRSFATQRLEGRMEAEMESAVWDRLLNLPTGFFRRYSTGDLASRSLAINQIREILTGSVTSALLSGVFSIFSFALLFSYSVQLAFVATGLAAVAISVAALSTWISIRLQREILAAEGKIAGRITELLEGVSKFRVSGTESRAFARWARDYAWQKRTMMKSARISMAVGIFDQVFPAVTTIVLYLFAASIIKDNAKFGVGSFLAFNATFGQFLGSTLGLSSALLGAVGIIPIFERARPILEELPEVNPDKLDPGPLTGRIELSHVTFRYKEDGPKILDDISFTINAGEYVAFVGASGCGKSTIMRLLLGFETPQTGSLAYDGRDLAELDLQTVRRQIGVVLQGGKLMAADIYTNIVGGSTLSIDVAWEAARRVGLDEDILAMPMGMYTHISESGGGLSGGQRQRIMIARALVHRPRVVFFDEATSALDNKTQSIVNRSLDAMQATRIVIAHRLSTIRLVDRIFVFKEGKLHEAGTFDELMANGGYFAELAKRQIA
jgi:NHLM bacteriocin system ABC transporter ATP-binding protein